MGGIEDGGMSAIASRVHHLKLSRGAQLKLRDAMGQTLSTSYGVIWITEENNPRDIVLQPGQSFRLQGEGLAMVEALTDAAISLRGDA